MKSVFGAAGFALGASAALIQRDQCCFSLTASGGASGTVSQLSDGQNRIGGNGSAASYCINNGQITDSHGRGCILTPPTTQFQCDAGATPAGGFSVSSSGQLQSGGSGNFYACPATDSEYNIYTTPVAGQTKCVQITLNTHGKCSGSGSSASASASQSPPASSAKTSAPASSAPAPKTSAPASSAPATSAPATSAPASSAPASSAPAPSAPASSPKTSAPASSAPASSAPASSAPASSAPASSAPASSAPASSAPAPSAPAPSAPASSSPASAPPAVTVPAASTMMQPCPAPATITVHSSCAAPSTVTVQTPGPVSTVTVSQCPANSQPAVSSAPPAPPVSAPPQQTTYACNPAHSYPNGAQCISTAGSLSLVTPTPSVVSSAPANTPATTYACNPAHSYPNGAHCVSTAGSLTLVTPTPSASTTYACNPAHSDPNGAQCISTAGSLTLVTPTASVISTPAANTPASAPPAKTPATTASQPSASGSACQTSLTGAYETPHLIVPVSSSSPDTAEGTQYNATISPDTSTIFNFDIPASYAGKQCSVVFLFPKQSELQTSRFDFSGNGSIVFQQLKSPASVSTTYNNAPKVQNNLDTIAVQPGNSYIVWTGACAAGTTQSIAASSAGSLSLEYFEDWNPSPIGLFITSC